MPPARRYDAWLGGKDNLAADRHSADTIEDAFPTIKQAARENRKWMRRAVRCLSEHDIRQFLDIGVGLPDPPNVHDIAQHIHPNTRVHYIDNDPLVGVHAEALLTDGPDGHTTFTTGDLRDPDTILHDAAQRLDFTQPIGLLIIAVLHFLPDTDHPHQLVARLVQELAPGSYLALTHATLDPLPPAQAHRLRDLAASGNHGALHPRTRDQVTAFFSGLDLAKPGLAYTNDWHPHLEPHPDPNLMHDHTATHAGLARKPR
ncbi:SAM-dependent methyltransferase [Mangrovihabitans endophyticus]|uniref:S-adenosyl methyltransferase n=1 Tax=Mangrovihabitans endophyticus TaxID=1751298 RepID=A0A8J3FNL2_9ACTN|nr:SAM-dependent methyltransferase [Mangrovihabitans endophyticus]GGK94019.1 hypothetical protein GCM10012284_30110 [Mangrovihabitans endophyticus]